MESNGASKMQKKLASTPSMPSADLALATAQSVQTLRRILQLDQPSHKLAKIYLARYIKRRLQVTERTPSQSLRKNSLSKKEV